MSTRRSTLSPKAPWPATDPLYDLAVPLREVTGVDSDFTTDERADYLAAEHTAPEGPAAGGLPTAHLLSQNPAQWLRDTVNTLYPGLHLKIIVWEEISRAAAGLGWRYKVVATGQALGAARVVVEEDSPRRAAEVLLARVGQARATATAAREAAARARRGPAVCLDCRATLGYNAESCQTCCDYVTKKQAA